MATTGTPWQRLRALDPFIFDALLALSLFIAVVGEGGMDVLAPALLISIPLIWRRRQPLVVYCLVLAGVIFAAQDAPYSGISAAMVATYSVGVYSPHRLLSLAVIVATAEFIVREFGGGLPSIPDYAGPFVVLVPMWLVGNAIRSWKLRAEALQERATLLAQEGERAMHMAIAEERARIAREMHDVIAHSVSVMVVQAGAARQVLTSEPGKATEALLAVEATGREAMTELRRLLGVVSDGGSDASLTPQPGVDQLDALVQRVGDAGLPVQLRIEGQPRTLPPGVDVAAYRIVQEALTNALKYSGLAPTEVVLDYRESELKVEVLDEGNVQGLNGDVRQGRGLVGMRERVALFGGTLEAGPRLERGYAVRAWLPY